MKIKSFSAFLLLMALTVNTAAASILGEPIEGGFYMDIGGGSYLYQNLYRSYQEGVGQQTEHYIEYVPNGNIVPVVSNGAEIFGKRTILEAYDYMKSNGLTPIAGINADFFSFQTGVPMSNTIIDGELITKESEEQHGIGFYADGTAFIGWMDFQTTLISENQVIDIYNVNKYRQPYTIYLMNDKFSDTTENTTPGLDVILSDISGSLKIGGEITATVETVMHSDGAIPIPKGKMVLTIDDQAFPDLYAQVSQLKAGEKVTIKSEALYEDRWKDVSYAIGCIGGRLVENGQVTGNFEAGSAPRTAVGIKADGQIVFYTIDGRQPGYSYGVTLETLAKRMIELGCVDAVNLDGGGSTVIGGIYPGSDVMSVINLPSEGSLRRCANYIFLQDRANSSGLTVFPAPVITTEPPAVQTALPETAAPVISETPVQPTPAEPDNSTPPTIKIDFSESDTPDIPETIPDSAYPVIDAQYYENLIITSISANSEISDVHIYIDGTEQNADISEYKGVKTLVYAAGSDFGAYSHKVKVTARTADGYDSIAYLTTPGQNGYKNPFADTFGHWAFENISYMADRDVVHGENIGNSLYFHPQNNMTRAEFAVMIANSLHINTAEFEGTAPAFADLDTIPEWALAHITAMYSGRIIMGKNSGNSTYFDPYAPITRAEAMTIIARTLPQNLKTETLNFADNGDIPLWAADSIGKLVSLGAVSGYADNTILPNNKITKAEGVKLLYEIY